VIDPPAPTFEDFFRTEWAGAVRLAAMLTQQTEAIEDLAQDALARVYANWDHATNPKAYLRVTIVNACRQWHRHKGVERAKLPLIARLDSVDFVAPELADAVAALPYRQRAVLVLRYYADLSEAEIAEALGCRSGTVKSLASRALARLEKDIQR
jgi:RNA polymerase sigma-70 factor (sigma-E family)